MLLRCNALWSVAWAGLTTGRYYWTHTAYMNTDDWTSLGQLALSFNVRVKFGYTANALHHGNRYINPADGSIVRTDTFPVGSPGPRPAVANYSILMAARWRFKAADGSEGYHLHRGPTDLAQVDNGQLTDAGIAANMSAAGSMYIPGDVYSSTGSPVVTWEVRREIAEWQLRHGTKRRNNRFWLP